MERCRAARSCAVRVRPPRAVAIAGVERQRAADHRRLPLEPGVVHAGAAPGQLLRGQPEPQTGDEESADVEDAPIFTFATRTPEAAPGPIRPII